MGKKEVNNFLQDLKKAKEVYYEVFEEPELIKVNPPRKIKLKQLSFHLKCVFLVDNGEKPVIISNLLSAKRKATGNKSDESE